jgi:hypothetical protein
LQTTQVAINQKDQGVAEDLKALRTLVEEQGRMMKKDRATVVKWTERVDELEDELNVAKAKMRACRENSVIATEFRRWRQPSEGGIPTPALSYKGSNDSYHTPPREGSPHNDSNGENRPPADRLAGIPEGARLVPITSDIDVYEWSEGGDEAAEAAEDALDDEECRRYFGVRVLGRRVGRQTCVKSVKKVHHPYRRPPGCGSKRRVFGETKRERTEL